MNIQTGSSISDWLEEAKASINGRKVIWQGVEFFAGAVDLDRWQVELYLSRDHDQPYGHGSLDSVEFI